jgi:hypothetical protein
MTTTVKVHVNGRYRAFVTQDGNEPVVVEGNYEGSPNPSGETSFALYHPANSTFQIREEAVPDAAPTEGTADQATESEPTGD